MNKKILLKTATITVPMLTLGLLVGSVASAATATKPQLTTEQKAIVEQIRSLHEQGKDEEARALAQSSDLPKIKMFFRHGERKAIKMDESMMQKHKEIATAVENNDYATFKELTADAPFADKVNETSFAKLVEAHKLMTQAKTLMEESGLHMPMGHPGMGMKLFNVRVDAPAETP